MTYSPDFRRKVLSIRESEGLTISQVSARFCVGIASVVRWIKRPEAQTKRNKPATRITNEALEKDIFEFPDAYQYERAARLGVSTRGIGHALCRMDVTFKKNSATPQGRRRQTAHLPAKD